MLITGIRFAKLNFHFYFYLRASCMLIQIYFLLSFLPCTKLWKANGATTFGDVWYIVTSFFQNIMILKKYWRGKSFIAPLTVFRESGQRYRRRVRNERVTPENSLSFSGMKFSGILILFFKIFMFPHHIFQVIQSLEAQQRMTHRIHIIDWLSIKKFFGCNLTD